jgi:hypothetical protein
MLRHWENGMELKFKRYNYAPIKMAKSRTQTAAKTTFGVDLDPHVHWPFTAAGCSMAPRGKAGCSYKLDFLLDMTYQSCSLAFTQGVENLCLRKGPAH